MKKSEVIKNGTDINNIEGGFYYCNVEGSNNPKLGEFIPTQQQFKDNPELVEQYKRITKT